MLIDIKECGLCGKDHGQVLFKKFSKPLKKDQLYDYWAMCPILREPILLRVDSSDKIVLRIEQNSYGPIGCQCPNGPTKKYSTAGCQSCWSCAVCGQFGGCDNRYWEYK